MKTLLICPAEREKVSALAEFAPLSNLPILGRCLLEYWLEHLVTLGATDVCILASDRPEMVRALVGDGARWGMRLTVQPELRELAPHEARAKYQADDDGPWLPAPHDVIVTETLPALPGVSLFESYAGWFEAVAQWLPWAAASGQRIGVHELSPGVWAGLHTHVAPTAILRAPCWLGEHVRIGPDAVIGPMVAVEDKGYVEAGAEISYSVVASETFVGRFSQVTSSIASGDTLVNWELDSCIKVPDSFLLGKLRRDESGWAVHVFGRLAALVVMLMTMPLALAVAARSKWRGQPAFHALLAVRPRPAGAIRRPGDTLLYYELNGTLGWLRRWPQLWSIFRGRFHWAGNRPLSPFEARLLSNDFERLWLSAPTGLLSLADVEGCDEVISDEACAHASYYAVRHDWKLDWSIFARAIFLLEFGVPYWKAREQFTRLFQSLSTAQGEAH